MDILARRRVEYVMSPLVMDENLRVRSHREIDVDYVNDTLFIVPGNDGEARRANQILTAICAPHHHISQQRWGASIDDEWQRLSPQMLKQVKRVLIFEMPGRLAQQDGEFAAEKRFRSMGIAVDIIDHHHYSWIDRYRDTSSLEQLCAKIGWTMDENDLAIAINDRSHVHGLKRLGYSTMQIRDVRRYDMMAQGYSYSFIDKQIHQAHALIKSLEKAKIENLWIFRNVRAHSAILIQELAIRNNNAVVHVFEMRTRKLGFSGEPTVVDQLLREDFTRLGYRPGYASYGGGDGAISKFWGFKPAHQSEEIHGEMERGVLATILQQLRCSRTTTSP